MDSKYTVLVIDSENYFFNNHLYWHVKNYYYRFRSCSYGELFVSNIPKNSTYSIGLSNQKRIYETIPAPNPHGCKIFCLKSKSLENLTVFIKTKGSVKNNKLKIKLENNLFEQIISANSKRYHNIFILCNTRIGKYFVHAGLINSKTPRKIVVKKVDSNILYENLDITNGLYNK
jgi:hypothetical protein